MSSKNKKTNSKSNQKIISDSQWDDIKKIYQKIKSDDEFEVMFFNYNQDPTNVLSLEKYMNMLEYLKQRHSANPSKTSLETQIMLDVVYRQRNADESYRITIDGSEDVDIINNYLGFLHLRKNHVIFKTLLTKMLEGDKHISLIKKSKKRENILDIDDYNFRVRLSQEEKVSKSEIESLQEITDAARFLIKFRHKQRVSLIVWNDNKKYIRIDLTSVKMTHHIGQIERTAPKYELEIEVDTKITSPSLQVLDTVYQEIEKVLKMIQQSNFIISSSDKKQVLGAYANLLSVDPFKMESLAGRGAVSLEINHLLDILPNKYAVSDKADGERYFLTIMNNSVYLISNILDVKDTGIRIPNLLSKYNYSILDGEYLFIPEYNHHLYLVFDCLMSGGEDVRKKSSLLERLKYADEIIKDCFIFDKQHGYDFSTLSENFEMKQLLKFHAKEIEKYMKELNHDLQIQTSLPLIRRKYFMGVLGRQNNEIYKYSELIWNKYVEDSNTQCPYLLDGLVFHPLEQEYVLRDSKHAEYKWKPPDKNSIDFYVLFERDPSTNEILTIFDNSIESKARGKLYHICNLHVGKSIQNKQQPVLFQPDTEGYIAHLFLEDGEARDIDGDIIQDGTVVEFYYDSNPILNEKQRWLPLRTRYDKTESVIRYGKKYGNYIDVADKIWRSITNPILISDFSVLAKDDVYLDHVGILQKKISLRKDFKKEHTYYQVTGDLAKPMRQFHNWIKDIMIYTYCSPQMDKKMSIIDFACGRGGDLNKMYHSNISNYVGIDIDYVNLFQATDGALSRYNKLKRNMTNVPPMYFIHADVGALLNYDSQLKALGGKISLENKKLFDKFFPSKSKATKFDRINCQFAVHYFLKNETTWNNFCDNVNMCLKPNGYMLITCFDGQKIVKLLNNKEKVTFSYTESDGDEKILFEIVKQFSNDLKEPAGLGNPITVYNATLSNEYIMEYLVDMRFIKSELEEKCNLKLVETDTFSNIFQINRHYFNDIENKEINYKTRNFLANVAKYYDQSSDINKTSYKFSQLNRFYIFKKQS